MSQREKASRLPTEPPGRATGYDGIVIVQSLFDMHACAPTATHTCSSLTTIITDCVLFFFVSVEISLFSGILCHCRFIFEWRVRRRFYLTSVGLVII